MPASLAVITACMSQLVNGRFDPPPHSSKTPQPIFIKFEMFNYLPDTTPYAKFQGASSTWVVWA